MTERRYVGDLIFDDFFERFGFERRKLFSDRSLKFYQPKESDNRIVILPPVYEPELRKNKYVWKSFGIVIYRHTGMTPENDEFPCMKIMRGQKCPFCEQFQTLSDSTEKRVYKPQMRGCLWVVDVSSKETEAEGTKLWVFSWAKETFLSFKKAMTDRKTQTVHNIFKEPRIFYFDMIERGEGKFKSMQVFAPELGDRIVDETKYRRWLERVKPFMEIINWPTEDEFESFFNVEDSIDIPSSNTNYVDSTNEMEDEPPF